MEINLDRRGVLTRLAVLGGVGPLVSLSSRRATAQSPTEGGEPTFGAYFAQHVGEDPTQEYEEWIDRPVLVSEEFIGKERHYRDIPAWKIDPWTKWLEENPNRRLAWDLKLKDLTSLRKGANGAMNDVFRSFGEQLVAEGHEDASLRIEGEFNLGHTIHPETRRECRWFVEYWHEIVDTFRAINGQQFDIVWNPTDDIALDERYAERTWPGDTYVDTVGVDIYDRSWHHYTGGSEPTRTDHERAWEDMEGRLDWFRGWADDHGKPLAVPEWGVWMRDGYPHAGGDDPYFIQQMYDWMQENDVTWQVYFEDLEKHSLAPDTHFPKSAATFKQLFGNGEGTVPADNPDNTITIESVGETVRYEFSVTGSVGENYGVETQWADRIEGTTGSGVVGPSRDSYTFSGKLARLEVSGPATVSLESERTNPADYSNNTITIEGVGGTVRYEFSVTGSVGENYGAEQQWTDNIAGNSGSGVVGPSEDSYTFSGGLVSFAVDGAAVVSVNRGEVESA